MRSGDGMASTEKLLDRVRIDITHPQRCEALLGQLRIVADIAEQKMSQAALLTEVRH